MTIVRTALALLGAERLRSVPVPDPADVMRLRARLDADGRRSGLRSLRILAVDTGCCGACAATVEELRLGRLGAGAFGLRFVSRPEDAEILLVTGLAVRSAAGPLARTFRAMGRSAIVVAVGDCASGGTAVRAASHAESEGGVAGVVPVDLAITGFPPAPEAILLGLLTLRDAASPDRPTRR